jgi:hypothetical protein
MNSSLVAAGLVLTLIVPGLSMGSVLNRVTSVVSFPLLTIPPSLGIVITIFHENTLLHA